MTLGHFLKAAALSGRPEDLAALQIYPDLRRVGERKSEDEEGGETPRAKGAMTALNPESTLRREP